MKRDYDDLVSFLFPFSFFFFFFNFLLQLDLHRSKMIRPNKKQTNKHFSLRRSHTLLLNWAFHRFPPPQGFCWLAHSNFLNFLKTKTKTKTKRKKQNWLKRGKMVAGDSALKPKQQQQKQTNKQQKKKTKKHQTKPNKTKKNTFHKALFSHFFWDKMFFFFFNLA